MQPCAQVLWAGNPEVTAGCRGLLCASLLDVAVLGPMLCTPLAQGHCWELADSGAELLGMWASLQQLAVACSVLLWCGLGEQVMGKNFRW